MTLYVVLPWADPSVTWVSPKGGDVLDANRRFAARVLSKDVFAAAAAASRAQLSADSKPEALWRQVRWELALQTFGASPTSHRRLRALASGIESLASAEAPLRLQLDDLTLRSGTTQSFADTWAISAEPLPFEAELDAAVTAVGTAGDVVFWLERDQQLPAVLRLMRKLGETRPLTLAGRFAATHESALLAVAKAKGWTWRVTKDRALEAFVSGIPVNASSAMGVEAAALREGSSSKLEPSSGLKPKSGAEASLPSPREVSDAPGGRTPGAATGPHTLWLDGGDAPSLEPSRRWSGVVMLEGLMRGPPTGKPETVVVPFTRWTESVLGPGGQPFARADVEAMMARWREAGARVVGEWWVGAPGVDAPAHHATAEAILTRTPFDAIAGLRPFHWTIDRDVGSYDGGGAASLGPPKEGWEFARSRPVLSPPSIHGEAFAALLQELHQRISPLEPRYPARLAQAYVSKRDVPPPHGEWLALDADTAIFELPASLQGKPGACWTVANAVSGSIGQLDATIANLLVRARTPHRREELVSDLPPGKGEPLVSKLVERKFLREVEAVTP